MPAGSPSTLSILGLVFEEHIQPIVHPAPTAVKPTEPLPTAPVTAPAEDAAAQCTAHDSSASGAAGPEALPVTSQAEQTALNTDEDTLEEVAVAAEIGPQAPPACAAAATAIADTSSADGVADALVHDDDNEHVEDEKPQQGGQQDVCSSQPLTVWYTSTKTWVAYQL